MATGNLRREVLKSFKKLHRARCAVFKGDEDASDAARKKINEVFKKNKSVANEDSVKTLIQCSDEAAEELLTNVVQFKLVDEDKYRLIMRPGIKLLKNVPFAPGDCRKK